MLLPIKYLQNIRCQSSDENEEKIDKYKKITEKTGQHLAHLKQKYNANFLVAYVRIW